MYIKRSIIHRANESKATRNAVALLILCKEKLDVHFIKNFSYNKLHKLTGLHITTLKKRVKTLIQMGLAHISKGHLTLNRYQQRQERNNVFVDSSCLQTLKDYEYTIATLCVASIQVQKDYIRKAFDNLRNPKTLQEHKDAKKFIRLYGYTSDFVDNGISYETIAKRIGVSIMTAVKIIKFAVKNGFLSFIKRYYKVSSYNISQRCNKDNSSYTFSTKNNIYKIFANLYSLQGGIGWQISDYKK